MSSNKNKASGSTTNQAAGSVISQAGEGELNIPSAGIAQAGEGGNSADAPATGLGQTAAMGIDVAAADALRHTIAKPEISTSVPAPGSLAEFAAQLESPKAANRPVVISQRNEQSMESLAQRQVIDVPTTGRLDDFLGDRRNRSDLVLEPVASLGFEDHAAQLAFLEELVIINIAESADPTAENPVQLGINGRQVFIRRGEDTIVKRKYVEQLLRAKPTNVKTQVAKNAEGDVVNRTIKTSAMKYPFSMVRDDNKLGAAWMRKVLSEG